MKALLFFWLPIQYSVEGIQVKYVCQKNLFDFNIIFVFVLTL